MRSTRYAAELSSAVLGGYRIERIFVKETLEEAIRFSSWTGGRFSPRPFNIREDELLVLLGDAIAAGVFTPHFLGELSEILDARRTP
jgi:hypothetical protein